MNNEFKREVVSPNEEVFTRDNDLELEKKRLMAISERIYEKMEQGYDMNELINDMNLPFSERIEVQNNLRTLKEKNGLDTKRYKIKHKIKSRKRYEEEINEEKRNVTLNSIAVGATSLAAVVCFSVSFGGDLEFERTVSTFILGMISAGASVPSIRALVTSISRKTILEDSYKINYKIDELSKEETRGKSLWLI